MSQTTETISYPSAARRALRPPIHDPRFWAIQLVVVGIVIIHFYFDVHPALLGGELVDSVPVAALVLPIGYAGMRYGFAGSFATAAWATLLWLPDLLLPHDEGHVLPDVMNLVIVLAASFVFGQVIESERLAHRRIEEATARALAVEVGYHQLFEANRSPILVVDDAPVVRDANPAARTVFGDATIGASCTDLLAGDVSDLAGSVISLPDGHDYRVDVTSMPSVDGRRLRQVTFDDVTEERQEQRQARYFAQLVVQVEEDQRRRLAREMHDEPLQLFLHLARRLEALAETTAVPAEVSRELADARHQALDAASRLRTLSRDLRPPALDELGLVAALASLVADLDDSGGATVDLEVDGLAGRLSPELELAAFRIAQESLRNALRHASANHVVARLEKGPTALTLTITDDGRGFDPAQPRSADAAPSLGLVGMRERARLLGGTFDVRSSRAGTTVEAVLPLDAASAPRPITARS